MLPERLPSDIQRLKLAERPGWSGSSVHGPIPSPRPSVYSGPKAAAVQVERQYIAAAVARRLLNPPVLGQKKSSSPTPEIIPSR